MSESFFILSGTMRLFDGRGWVDAASGDYLYVPVGGLHAFRNESGEPASMLMLLFVPGAPRSTSRASPGWPASARRSAGSSSCATTASSSDTALPHGITTAHGKPIHQGRDRPW